MENQIIPIKSTLWRSFLIHGNELWLSNDRVSSIESFEKGLAKKGIMKSAYAFPLDSIQSVSFNEASDSIRIQYLHENGKEKKLNLQFDDKTASTSIGNLLAEKAGLVKSEKTENQTKPLLVNLLALVFVIVTTIVLSTTDTDEMSEGYSSRSRSRNALTKSIVETLGPTGVIIAGALISIYLGYRLYSRYKNPAKEIVYAKA